jgi:hypothetical protein
MSVKAELQRRKLQAKLLLKAVSPKAPVSSLVSPNAVAKSAAAERELLEEEKLEKEKKIIETPSPKGSKRNALVAAAAEVAASETTASAPSSTNSNEEAPEFLLPYTARRFAAFVRAQAQARESEERRRVAAEREREAAALRESEEQKKRDIYEEIKTTAERIPNVEFKMLLTRVNELIFNPDSLNVGYDLPLGISKEQYINQEKTKIPSSINRLKI